MRNVARHLFLVYLLAVTMAAAPVLTFAQDHMSITAETAPDFAAWDLVAQRAESALEAGRASDLALQQLRAELVGWRAQFAEARSQNAIRINTLTTQIGTLGPAPGEGGSEPSVLTERRTELTAQLNEAQVPVKAAEEAHSLSTVLIGEIDALIRSRQADQLLKLGPTPINPALWPAAFGDLTTTLRRAAGEVTTSWGSDTQRADLRADLPLTILLSVIAAVLLLRGRTWVIRFGAGVRARSHGPARGVWGFVLSLGQVAAPLIGIYALIEALNLAGVLGLRGQVLADSLPLLGLCVFGAAWLGNRVFGIGAGTWSILHLSAASRTEGRFDSAMIGLVFGLALTLARLAEHENFSDTTRIVLGFPLLLAAGILLIRLGRLLQQHARFETEAADNPRFRIRTLSLLGRLLVLAGIAGPVSAAVGYTTLAQTFLYPTVLTNALIAGFAVLHRFFTSFYGLVTGKDEAEAGEALIPVLASFGVVILSAPLLALIWGARVTDLTELWTRVGQGIQVGESRIQPGDFLTFLVVFAVGFALTRLIQGMLKLTILPKTSIDLGGRNAITSGLGYVGIFLAVIIAVSSAGIDLSSLAIVAGALSVGIGFGLQNIVSNFVSGIILLIERPISEGDWIEVNGQMGYVRDISVRSTRVETFDRQDVILPNSDLISGVVTNYTRGNLIGRVIVPVGVAYGTDTRRVETILREVAEAHPMVSINPAPSVIFQGFGADSLDFEIRAILRDVNYVLTVKSDMNHEIARRFAEEDIEIPFAQRDIWLRNPEALGGSAPASDPYAPTRSAHPEALAASDMHNDTDTDADTGDGDE